MVEGTEKKLVKLEKEFCKQGEEEYVRDLRRASFEELENKLKELSKHREAIDETKDRDEELKQAMEVVKNLKAPYVEQKKWASKRAKMIYLIMCEEHPAQMTAYGEVHD